MFRDDSIGLHIKEAYFTFLPSSSGMFVNNSAGCIASGRKIHPQSSYPNNLQLHRHNHCHKDDEPCTSSGQDIRRLLNIYMPVKNNIITNRVDIPYLLATSVILHLDLRSLRTLNTVATESFPPK